MNIQKGIIEAISISKRKGVAKTNVPLASLREDWGIEGDAHAGKWHRQVSLLASESVNKMRRMGATVGPGDFAENLTINGLDLLRLGIGDRLQCGEAELEITQIGKTCHNRCAIYQAVGDCVMPREGVFARVVRGGTLRIGMEIIAISPR